MERKYTFILIDLAILLGFILMIKSVHHVMDSYFILGLLLFTLGCYWYSYRRGYHMGRIAEYERQRKNRES